MTSPAHPAADSPAGRFGVRRLARRAVRELLALGAGLAILPPVATAAPSPSSPPLHFGFSRQIFDSVNENDGRAALKLHAEAIGRSEGIAMAMCDRGLNSPREIEEALATGRIDLVALPTDEYLALPPAVVAGPLIVAIMGGRPDDEYVLVTRRERGVTGVAGLPGRRIIVQRGVKMPLSRVWLDVLTLRENLGPAERFFGEIRIETKPSRTILPVFFGQADACVVSRHALRTMGELNPQIVLQLATLSTSPSIVPSVMCFRAGMAATEIDRVVAAVRKMHRTTSGRQVTVIFQSDRLDTLPEGSLETARNLLAEHARLLAAAAPPPDVRSAAIP